MKMHSLYQKKSLSELYSNLEKMINDDIEIRYPIEVKEMNNGIAFKIYSTNEDLTIFFYPNHPVSEVNIIRKGMRFIYPKRMIRFKRHTIGDFIELVSKDDRMQGCQKIIEMYFIAIFKQNQMAVSSLKSS